MPDTTPQSRGGVFAAGLRLTPARHTVEQFDANSAFHFSRTASAWCGKASSWLIIVLTDRASKSSALHRAPWMFDATTMIYGTLFMMCSAYTLAQTAMCVAISCTAR
jgi:hypothetical protein